MNHFTKMKIKAALRKCWLFSIERRQILRKYEYRCGRCDKIFKYGKGLQVHHVNGIDWDDWSKAIAELFDGEQIPLCKECHKPITDAQRQERLLKKYRKQQEMMNDKRFTR